VAVCLLPCLVAKAACVGYAVSIPSTCVGMAAIAGRVTTVTACLLRRFVAKAVCVGYAVSIASAYVQIAVIAGASDLSGGLFVLPAPATGALGWAARAGNVPSL